MKTTNPFLDYPIDGDADDDFSNIMIGDAGRDIVASSRRVDRIVLGCVVGMFVVVAIAMVLL